MVRQILEIRQICHGYIGWLVAVATLILAGCATNLGGGAPTSSVADTSKEASGSARHRSVKIAMLLPLKGFDQTAAIAKGMKQAGEMALFEKNNPSIQLIVKDDKGTPAGATAAATEALSEGAEIILGPLFAKSVKAIAPIARSAKVPVLAFSNDRTVAGNGIYLMSFLPEPEVERILTHTISTGRRRFAALIPDNAYGRTVGATFNTTVTRLGGQIVVSETYSPKANGMLEPAQRVLGIVKESNQLGAPVDALFLPGGQELLPNLGPHITYASIDTTKTKLIGTGAWEFPNIGRDKAFVGGWYPGPDPRGWQSFSERFAKNFGQAPPRLASLAYDAVSLSISLSANRKGQRFTNQTLTRPSGFSGVDGLVRFNPNGIAQRSLAILEVQKFGSQVVNAAPSTITNNARISSAPAPSSGGLALPFFFSN